MSTAQDHDEPAFPPPTPRCPDPAPRHLELVGFCPMCFASTDDASGGGEVMTDGCTNCGAMGEIPMLRRGDVECIRRSASWVGRRHYPQDEDKEILAERRALLSMVTGFPGRTAEPATNGADKRWLVRQQISPTKAISITVSGVTTAANAIAATRYSVLPYVPAAMLEPDNPTAPELMSTDDLMGEVARLVAANVAGKAIDQERFKAVMDESARRGIKWAVVKAGDKAPPPSGPAN
jgi:hypothetical protein